MKKRFFKKNQIIITALAVLIAIAGYINYADSILKKGKDSKSTSTVTCLLYTSCWHIHTLKKAVLSCWISLNLSCKANTTPL